MILALIILIAVLGILLMVFTDMEILEAIGFALTFISGIALLVSVVGIAIVHTTADSTKAQMNERYNALTYKLESGACRDDFGLLSKEVIDEIQEWNEEIASYKKLQSNSWVGVYVPNIYDDFKLIDYNNFVR